MLAWLGYALAARCIWLLFLFASKRPEVDRQRTLKALTISALLAFPCITLGTTLSRSTGGLRVPLVWWVMPFCAWLAVGAQVGFWLCLFQAAFALSAEERYRKIRAAVAWLVLTAIGVLWYRTDPENSIGFLHGSIPVSWPILTSIVLVAIASAAAMALATYTGRSRKLTTSLATQISLLVGCLVFGIPLVFLLITSFKEDRDMSSPNGIIWVPRVQRTVAYFDPTNPLYEFMYRGEKAEATLMSRSPNGTATMDIATPEAVQGLEVEVPLANLKEVPRQAPLVLADFSGVQATGMVVEDLEDGRQRVRALSPSSVKGKEVIFSPDQVQPIRDIGLRWRNYTEALGYLPPETLYGLVFLRNTLIIALLSVLGTILSSSLAAYAFARMRFPGRELLFGMFLATMMLPTAVVMLQQFLIFRRLGWIDTLLPLWVPSFFGSALNIFLLRQFFRTIPMELEDAAKIDGCSFGRTFWSVMLPQIKPALAVIGVTTFMGAWNNFMGPLIYINSSTKMPISYALQLFMGDRSDEPGLLMAFTMLTILPVLLLFFFAQRYFIENVTLSGLGGK